MNNGSTNGNGTTGHAERPAPAVGVPVQPTQGATEMEQEQTHEEGAQPDGWEFYAVRAESRIRHHELTQAGNAERLIARFGHKIRYCHTWGKWLIWDGRRW
jgi:hypothetical protein